MSDDHIYVCDSCGSIVTITAKPIPEGQSWKCDGCGAIDKLWHFTDVTKAMWHSALIRERSTDEVQS